MLNPEARPIALAWVGISQKGYLNMNDLVNTLWDNGIKSELINFIKNLNWTYIFIMIITFYGLNHVQAFRGIKELFKKWHLNKFSHLFCAIVIGVVFIFFKSMEDKFEWSYVSALLRSLLIAIVFSHFAVNKIVKLIHFD